MKKTLKVSKADVEKIIAAWWKDYWARPDAFKAGPDFEGKSSADCFFEYAKKVCVGT